MEKSVKDNLIAVFKDILHGCLYFNAWLRFGWYDIKLRYRRSLLGPFWITISVGVMVAAMGILYSQIFQQEIESYLPFVGCSFILWFFISGMINEGCTTFIVSEHQIRQINLPLSVYALRLLWRNIIVFLHNFVVMALLIIIFGKYSLSIIIFLFTFSLICTLFFFYNMTLGIVCARYRDVPPIVLSVTQLLMFITPIFWQKEFLTKYHWITDLNPVFHILEILRNPLLGKPFPMYSLFFVFGILAFLITSTVILLYKYRNRVAYWV